MAIFSRIYRIFQANISAKKGNKSNIDNSFYEWYTDNKGTRPRQSNNTRPRQPRNPEMAKYYANLEIPYGADLETARKSWKRLLRKYHPDLHSDDTEKIKIANEIVQGLNLAYKEIEKHYKSQNT